MQAYRCSKEIEIQSGTCGLLDCLLIIHSLNLLNKFKSYLLGCADPSIVVINKGLLSYARRHGRDGNSDVRRSSVLYLMTCLVSFSITGFLGHQKMWASLVENFNLVHKNIFFLPILI